MSILVIYIYFFNSVKIINKLSISLSIFLKIIIIHPYNDTQNISFNFNIIIADQIFFKLKKIWYDKKYSVTMI